MHCCFLFFVTCSFAVNIGPDEQDITLHINPRFNAHGDKNAVVCNSYEGGNWCEEVREGGFPFQQGEEFKVCPYCQKSVSQHFYQSCFLVSLLLSNVFLPLDQHWIHSCWVCRDLIRWLYNPLCQPHGCREVLSHQLWRRGSHPQHRNQVNLHVLKSIWTDS